MDELYQRLTAYQTAMSLARNMLRQGIISEDDYCKIDTIIAKKPAGSACRIYRFDSPTTLDIRPFER